jgi:hypothetical protein
MDLISDHRRRFHEPAGDVIAIRRLPESQTSLRAAAQWRSKLIDINGSASRTARPYTLLFHGSAKFHDSHSRMACLWRPGLCLIRFNTLPVIFDCLLFDIALIFDAMTFFHAVFFDVSLLYLFYAFSFDFELDVWFSFAGYIILMIFTLNFSARSLLLMAEYVPCRQNASRHLYSMPTEPAAKVRTSSNARTSHRTVLKIPLHQNTATYGTVTSRRRRTKQPLWANRLWHIAVGLCSYRFDKALLSANYSPLHSNILTWRNYIDIRAEHFMIASECRSDSACSLILSTRFQFEFE